LLDLFGIGRLIEVFHASTLYVAAAGYGKV